MLVNKYIFKLWRNKRIINTKLILRQIPLSSVSYNPDTYYKIKHDVNFYNTKPITKTQKQNRNFHFMLEVIKESILKSRQANF